MSVELVLTGPETRSQESSTSDGVAGLIAVVGGSDRKTLAGWVVIGHYPIIGTGAICVSNNEGGVDVFSLNLIIRIGGKRGFHNQDDRAGKGGFSRYWVWIEKVSGICRVLINCCRHVPSNVTMFRRFCGKKRTCRVVLRSTSSVFKESQGLGIAWLLEPLVHSSIGSMLELRQQRP